MRVNVARTLTLLTALLIPFSVAAAAKMPFEIAAGEAPDALREFGRQARVQLLFEYRLVRDLKTRAVMGDFEREDALAMLLNGTGLIFEFVNERTIAIHPAARTFAESKGDGSGDAAERMNSLLDRFRLAQADQGSRDETPASASAGPQSLPETSENRALEEIIVTAQKRSGRLQDTPISITALNDRDIERRGLVDRSDYLRSVPGVSLMDSGPGLSNVIIRGVYGSAFQTGPTVGIYLADIPLTGYALGGSSDVILEDMERVEVLRGPQGTLYGSNALSGAVRYIPRAPDPQTFQANVQAGYSNTAREGGNNTMFQGILNVPVITDKLAVRAVAYRHDNEGYYRSNAGSNVALQSAALTWGAQHLVVDKAHAAGSSYVGGRLSALWKPTDALRLNLTYLKQDVTQETLPVEDSLAGAYTQSRYELGYPAAGEDPLEIDLDILNVVGELDLGWGALLSSTAWTDQDFVRNTEVGGFFTGLTRGIPAPITQPSVTFAKVFTEEVRLTSASDEPLGFVVGLYYEDSEQPTGQPTYFSGDPAVNPFRSLQMWDLLLDRQVKQKAAFGELSYRFASRFKATAGGRYFDYDTRFIRRVFNSVVIAESASDDRSTESGNTFKGGLEFKASDNALAYATWSEGFRLGRPLGTLAASLCDQNQDGFLDGTTIPTSLTRVSSDTLESLELGAKFTFLGGRATLNAAAYDNDWKDIPVVVAPTGCATTTTINGGTARARGAELEGTLGVGESFRLGFGVGYVDAELTATTSAGSTGDRMNFTPELNGNLNLEYGFPFARGESFVRADYTYFGEYFTGTGERGRRAPGFGTVNLSTGISWGRLSAQLLVANLLNADDVTSLEGGLLLPNQLIRQRPRTVGLTVGYNF